MGERSRVLVLSYWNLNHAAFGGGRRIEALLELLGERALLCQPAPPHPRWASAPFRADFGRRWGLFNFFWPATAARVRRLVRAERPGAVLLTSIWAFAPFRRLAARPPLVLDAHDVLCVAIGERFGAGHPFTRLVRAAERAAARAAQHVFVCSDHDRRLFLDLYGLAPERVSTVPNGVDVDRYAAGGGPLDPQVERRLAGGAVLLFMGKADYQPNREALRFLNETVMPRLEAAQPGRFRLLVCGGAAPRGAFHPSFVFAGRVPSVIPYLHRADVCLAPVFTGSGTRLKILEYFGAGRPVVATAKGAEGLGCRDGEHLVVAAPERFAAAVAALADEPARAAALARAGQAFARERYDWSAIRERWKAVLQQWVDFGAAPYA
jgi:glycosyltransferase involved in cell wall biosynthesis